jgi:hypothetical protein
MAVGCRAVSRGKAAIVNVARQILRRAGFDLLPRSYYSPIPELGVLPADHFARPLPMPGLRWDVGAQLALLEGDLAPHVRAFPFPREPSPDGGFHLDNGNYESVDAELLWAFTRHLRPRRVVELGSGWSTLVIAGALEANARDGHPATFVAYDPYPRPIVSPRPAGLHALEAIGAADVPLERFTELEAGDILFVDTTHTVKAGSDVNRIVLEVLPQLAPGVAVHIHDIFLPYEYPEEWLREQQWYWAEQYLLQAFLAFNDRFEVLLGANALARAHAARVGAVVPSFSPDVVPGALWLRRTAA